MTLGNLHACNLGTDMEERRFAPSEGGTPSIGLMACALRQEVWKLFHGRALGWAWRGQLAARCRGFSLIELMVVLVILGLLTGLVGPRLFGRVDSSKIKATETQVKMLKSALQTYRLDVGQYPSTAQGLGALMKPPPEVADYWDGPYLEDELPLDPWREDYVYQFPAENLQGFALYSLGADSLNGGEGINADVGYLPEQ